MDMAKDIYEFLGPFAGTPENKKLIDFCEVPGKLPEEPKIELPPVD